MPGPMTRIPFGDAGGFGDIEEVTLSGLMPDQPDRSRGRRGGFGDSDGFGDAGTFDLRGQGRRRSDSR